MVAGNRNRVELRHILRGVLEDVGNDLHRECRRIDIGVTHHELLQDVVLNGSGHLFELGTLFQSGHDIEGQDGQHGSVHGHRDRHLVQGNTAEEHLHVLLVADTHTCLTHITHYTSVIGVVTTVCRQVEGHRKTFLTRSQVTAIESIRLLSRGESCILADGPWAEGVHHGIGTAEEGRNTSREVKVFHAFEVFFRINGTHLDMLGSLPVVIDVVVSNPLGTVLGLDASVYVYIIELFTHNSSPPIL